MTQKPGLTFVKSDGELSFYLYRSTLAHMYYDDGRRGDWPSHQTSFSHKLHMSVYLAFGGCNILYMFKDDRVVSYLVFSRGGNAIIKGTSKADVYTVFVWTYPEFRGMGYGKRIVRELVKGGFVSFDKAYKTIAADNAASIGSALANGYRRLYSVQRTKLLHTAYKAENDNYHLYVYERT